MNRAELKSKAKEQLKGRWGLAIITVLVSNLIINSYNMSSRFRNRNFRKLNSYIKLNLFDIWWCCIFWFK